MANRRKSLTNRGLVSPPQDCRPQHVTFQDFLLMVVWLSGRGGSKIAREVTRKCLVCDCAGGSDNIRTDHLTRLFPGEDTLYLLDGLEVVGANDQPLVELLSHAEFRRALMRRVLHPSWAQAACPLVQTVRVSNNVEALETLNNVDVVVKHESPGFFMSGWGKTVKRELAATGTSEGACFKVGDGKFYVVDKAVSHLMFGDKDRIWRPTFQLWWPAPESILGHRCSLNANGAVHTRLRRWIVSWLHRRLPAASMSKALNILVRRFEPVGVNLNLHLGAGSDWFLSYILTGHVWVSEDSLFNMSLVRTHGIEPNATTPEAMSKVHGQYFEFLRSLNLDLRAADFGLQEDQCMIALLATQFFGSDHLLVTIGWMLAELQEQPVLLEEAREEVDANWITLERLLCRGSVSDLASTT